MKTKEKQKKVTKKSNVKDIKLIDNLKLSIKISYKQDLKNKKRVKELTELLVGSKQIKDPSKMFFKKAYRLKQVLEKLDTLKVKYNNNKKFKIQTLEIPSINPTSKVKYNFSEYFRNVIKKELNSIQALRQDEKRKRKSNIENLKMLERNSK